MGLFFFHADGTSGVFGVIEEFELAVAALGACIWCLKRAHIDYTLLSLACFEVQHRTYVD